jgi:hypothetical protein
MNNQKYSFFLFHPLNHVIVIQIALTVLVISWYVPAKEAWVLVLKNREKKKEEKKERKKYWAQVLFKVFKVQKREESPQGAK